MKLIDEDLKRGIEAAKSYDKGTFITPEIFNEGMPKIREANNRSPEPLTTQYYNELLARQLHRITTRKQKNNSHIPWLKNKA